jgi:hypothetical protein
VEMGRVEVGVGVVVVVAWVGDGVGGVGRCLVRWGKGAGAVVGTWGRARGR